MNTRIRFSVGARLAAAACILFALVVMGVATPALAHKGLICGTPRAGHVTVNVMVKIGDGLVVIRKFELDIYGDVSAEQKAELIRILIGATHTDPSRDEIHAGGEGATVLPTGANGSKIMGIWLSRDSTYEDDKFLASTTSTDDRGLCSLSGTASGNSPTGGQGYVRVAAFGRVAQVPTFPGMPAQVAEQQLMQQLSGQGVEARPAGPADFQGAMAALTHDTGVIYIGPGTALGSPVRSAAPSAVPADVEILEVTVSDAGLMLDLAGVSYPDEPVVGVGADPRAGSSSLEVSRTIFQRGPVKVKYASGNTPGPVSLTAHDAQGRMLRQLFQSQGEAEGEIRWDGRDSRGIELPGGVFFLRLHTGSGALVRRVVRVP